MVEKKTFSNGRMDAIAGKAAPLFQAKVDWAETSGSSFD
jgi:hypothetical protein